ncbi:MAG TPA: hypothetical protein DCY64_05735 [Hydrogenophaga sp.]|uniref:glycosyltransferase family 39 protein n=1 Tax=Hydrogenophaga sp. TaxID=1904254 RepID=UPI0008C1B82B|nr:glycosyltransferase family 39 protein [Hydrogenophaga sp.]OGA76585.1 MAG: hypothetical protein A2X73_19995 [Burkholderiales bacterium GWE1_65_30]OGA91501.1 MAG: hypothetical protein A2X72_04900 [Burkholderiales bacterium GWF1_66_17]HAX19767.1 hypothetical protein [Hydrogenophaga sp.]HBU20174.1 hypothetical protein [Hydrogenophaga sp.]
MNNRPWPAYLVATLFACLAVFLAIFVTPTGDLPDESGHYAYVVDMTKGRPFPLLGQAEIPPNLWRDIEGVVDHHRKNYIVQHPPLYYGIAAIPYAIVHQFTEDKHILARAPRMVSALSLGLLVLILFRMLAFLGFAEGTALAGASLIGFIPMVTHLASGISNDLFLTLMGALATLYLVKYVVDGQIRHAYACAFWLACAGATKMTAWILIAAYVGILLFEMRKRGLLWIGHALAVSLLSVSTALWWMRRNIYHFGDPFYIHGSHLKQMVFDYSLLDYFRQQPFFEWLMYHFYALIGFSGYCQTPQTAEQVQRLCHGGKLFRVEGPSYLVFTALALVCVLALLAAITRNAWRATAVRPEAKGWISLQAWASSLLGNRSVRKLFFVLLFTLGTAGVAFALINSHNASWARTALPFGASFLLAFAGFLGIASVFTSEQPHQRLTAYGPLLLTLFVALLFYQGYKAILLAGSPHGIQGRYLLPFVPLLLASFMLATKTFRYQAQLLLVICLCMGWAYVNAYATYVIPFFQHVRI